MPRRGSRCRRPPPLQSRTVPTRNRAAADRERQGAIGGPCPREVVQCLSLQRERRSLSGKRYLTGRVFARFASDTAHVRAVRTPQHSHESHRDRTRRVIGTQTRVRGSRGLSIYSGCGSSSHGRAHPGTRLARVRSPGTPNANRPARRRSASGLRESRNPRQHARTTAPAHASVTIGHSTSRMRHIRLQNTFQYRLGARPLQGSGATRSSSFILTVPETSRTRAYVSV